MTTVDKVMYASMAVAAVAGLWLIVFPSRVTPISGNRDRATVAAIALVTLAFAVPLAPFSPGIPLWGMPIMVALRCLFGVPIYLLYAWARGQVLLERKARVAKADRAIASQRGVLAMTEFRTDLAARYPFVLNYADRLGNSLLCMDAEGRELRFLQVAIDEGAVDRRADLTVAIADVVSVELVHNERVYTESATTTRKKGAIGRAVTGELLFGGVGAVVGAVSAGSTSTTVGAERRVYQSSELVFGLADLTNPVVRFVHDDPAEADRWLYRVRSAMTRAKNSLPAHLGVARLTDSSIAPKFDPP